MTTNEFDARAQVLLGDTANVELQRAQTILRSENLNPSVSLELFSDKDGVVCGINESVELLGKILPERGSEVWALDDGDSIKVNEVVMRIKAPYSAIALYESALTGILSSSTSWSTAARDCVNMAGDTPVISNGASGMHPNVAAVMDYSAIIGGCVGCSTILGARMSQLTPFGTMPTSLPLIFGDTVTAAKAMDDHLPQGVPRISLVHVLQDEAIEALNLAEGLGERLRGIFLNSPQERGGVTIELGNEVRARLDLASATHVEIFVGGDLTPKKIEQFSKANSPIAGYIVSKFISEAPQHFFNAELHEVDGKPVARRGRLPGPTANSKLRLVL